MTYEKQKPKALAEAQAGRKRELLNKLYLDAGSWEEFELKREAAGHSPSLWQADGFKHVYKTLNKCGFKPDSLSFQRLIAVQDVCFWPVSTAVKIFAGVLVGALVLLAVDAICSKISGIPDNHAALVSGLVASCYFLPRLYMLSYSMREVDLHAIRKAAEENAKQAKN